MIGADELLARVGEIASERPRYRTGGTGADGSCDCVGLIMGAMYRAGRARYDMHSSNYFARYQTEELRELGSAEDCFPGMVVYKRRDDEAQLNARYLPGGRYWTGDRRDYYHVGVVTGVGPLAITHCTSGGGADGVAVDGKLGKWCCGGRLGGVAYTNTLEGAMEMAQFAKIVSEDGNPVRLRSGQSTKDLSNVLVKLPVDTVVRVQAASGAWSRVECSYGGQAYSGFVMAKFLEPTDEPTDEAASGEDDAAGEASLGAGQGVGLWIPCASLAAAKTLARILSTGVVKAGE